MCRTSSGLTVAADEHRPAQRVGRHAVQVEADRLEAGRVGRVGVDARRDLVGGGDLPRQVGVVDVGRVRLRREHRALQRDERRIGRLQAAVDLLVEVHVLLVVVEPQARQQAQAIGDRPSTWPNTAALTLPERHELVVAVAVEQARRGGGALGASRKRAAAEPCSCLNDGVRVERLVEARSAPTTRFTSRRQVAGVAHFLRPLPLVDGAAEIVVTGRPMKSRSFDGFQSQ